MRGLSDKVGIVTGAGSGIGEAVARRLAEEGVRVAVVDINATRAELVADDIRAGGGKAIGIAADISKEEEVEHAVRLTVAEFGQLDILHNNAAATAAAIISRDCGVADAQADVWDLTMSVNVRGTVLGCKYALREMLPRRSGVIINTSSSSAILGDLTRAAYGASKAAIISITQHVATLYGRQGIRCVAVAPGPIITDALRAAAPEALPLFERHLLLPRQGGTPEEIAGTVAFLASTDAAFITGTTLVADGGLSSHTPWFADVIAGMQA